MNELARPHSRCHVPPPKSLIMSKCWGRIWRCNSCCGKAGRKCIWPPIRRAKALQDLLGYDKLKELAARPRVAHAACHWPNNGLPPCCTGRAIPRPISPALCACLTWRCGAGCVPKRRSKGSDDGKTAPESCRINASSGWAAGPSIRFPGNPTWREGLATMLRQEEYHRVTPKADITDAAAGKQSPLPCPRGRGTAAFGRDTNGDWRVDNHSFNGRSNAG